MESHARRDQSLDDIDGRPWADPPADATRLVTTAHRLRRVPIGRLNVEALRLLIGQHESLDALVPLALERLEADPLAEGDFYPGDLLAAVLAIPATYWHAHPQERDRLSPIVDAVADPRGDLRAEAGFDIDAAATNFRTTLTR
jgi:hypothetical protein